MNNKKNILMITPCRLPVPATKGGAVETLADSFVKINNIKGKINLMVVAVSDDEMYTNKVKLNTEYKYLKKNQIVENCDYFLDYVISGGFKNGKARKNDFIWRNIVLLKVYKLLRLREFDAIIVENERIYLRLLYSKNIRDKYKGKIFYHIHNDISSRINKRIINNCNVIGVSNYLEKRVRKIYGNKIKYYTLYNGINIDLYNQSLNLKEKNEIKKSLGFKEDDKVVCFVGRMTPNKGVAELIKAMQLIDDDRVKLMIVGATDFANNIHSEFEKKIKSLCISMGDKIKFTGYVPNEKIWKYYRISDVAVLPSKWQEPFGLTIVEALASGLPVITTKNGGIPEVINKECGILLDSNADDFIENIAISIVNVLHDSSMLQSGNNDTKEYIKEKFSEDAYYKQFVNILEGLYG